MLLPFLVAGWLASTSAQDPPQSRIHVGPVPGLSLLPVDPPPDCPCPQWPLNPSPIKFGAPLKLVTHKGDLSLDVREAYVLFFTWLNEVRGGLCIGGKRYLTSLLLIHAQDTLGVTNAALELVQKEGVKFLLAPYGSSATEPAAQVAHANQVMLMAGAASSGSLFRGRPSVFGTLPPAGNNLDAVFDILGQDKNLILSVIQANTSFGREACSRVSQLASNYQLRFANERTLSTADEANLTQILQDALDPTNGVLLGCGFNVDQCNKIVASLSATSIVPKAVVLTVCTLTPGFDLDLGRFTMGTTTWLPQFNVQAQPPSVDSIIGTSTEWANLYTKEYGAPGIEMVVSYQAASSWAACVVMTTAMEQADSLDPREISMKIHVEGLQVPTIFARIAFDNEGQNSGLWGVAQQQGDNKVHLVAPVSNVSRTPIFPKPTLQEEPCWESVPANSAKGFDGSTSTCETCPLLRFPQVARFNYTTMRRECVSCQAGQTPLLSVNTGSVSTTECTKSCPPGTGTWAGSLNCTVCPVGTYSNGFFCVDCAKGEFSDAPGATACQACAVGTFSDQVTATACQLCAEGREATQARSVSCRRCSKGTVAAAKGSSACRLCDAGTVAPELNSTGCYSCSAGTFSAWGADACLLCNEGSYQNKQGQSTCIDGGSLGASFDAMGLDSGINKDWFWTKLDQDDLSWELCVQNPNACLHNESCKLGTTGYQCASCIPGYAHVRSRGAEACFKCPPWLQNFAVTVFVFAVCIWVVFWLARASVQSISRPRDKRSQLLKLAISYFLMADVAFEMTMETVLDYLYSRDWNINVISEVIHWMVWPFRLFPGFMLESESSLWSLHCLFQSDKPELAALLASLPTGAFYDPSYASYWAELQQYQADAEQALTIFFLLWPLLIMASSYLVGLFLVWRHLRKHREYYEQAFMFYDDLVVDADKATSTRTRGAWTSYVKTYDSRIAGLWRPVPHAEARMKGVSCICWSSFHHQGLPVVHSILLVCQGAALLGCMRPLVCAAFTLPDEANGNKQQATFLRRHANMHTCEYRDVAAFLGCFLWGIVTPAVIWLCLRKVTGRWSHGLDEHCVVLSGYAFHAWYWEALTMFNKFVMLVCVRAGNDGQLKNLLLVLLGMFYGIVSMSANPHKFKLVSRINGQFVLLWLVHVFISDFITTLVVQGPPAWLILLLVMAAVSLHTAFLINLLVQLHFQNVVNFMMDIDVPSWQRSLEEPAARNIVTVFRRKTLGQYMRHLRSKSYVSLQAGRTWVAMIGNRADIAAIPPRIDKAIDLSECPSKPVNVVTTEATRGQKQELQASLRIATGLVVEATGLPTISISILEFVVRAGMVFGMHHEHQRRKISRYLAEPAKHQQQGTQAEAPAQTTSDRDPLELLGSIEDLEEGATSPGPRSRAVIRGVEDDEDLGALAEDRWLCHEVSTKESERRSGVLPPITHSAQTRKRASAATHGSSSIMLNDLAHKFWQKTATGGRSRSQLAFEGEPTAEQLSKCLERIHKMFDPASFTRGVELGSLQLGLMDLAEVPPFDMRLWMDTFESVWTLDKATQMHKESRLRGMITDQNTQTEAVRNEDRQLALVPTYRDPWTVSALPLLGILPPSRTPRSRVGITSNEDKMTQTDSGVGEAAHRPSMMGINFHPMEDRSKAAALSWARLVSLYAVPPIKVVGRLLHNRTVRYLRDLSLEITAAQQSLQAARHQRVALERRQVRKVLGEVAKSPKPGTPQTRTELSPPAPLPPEPNPASKQKVLPPAQRGMYED